MLSGARTARPSCTADKDGSHVARLIVSDGPLASAADRVTVVASPGNPAPVAHAGPDPLVPTGATVTLDGSARSDADADRLGYAWSLVSRPLGSVATPTAARTARPTVVADKRGSCIARLVVDDGKGTRAADGVTVIADRAPIANAGADQTVRTGTLVTLHGTSSVDPDGDPITRSCTLSRPCGSSATLTGARTAKPTFVADRDGRSVARLIVHDGIRASVADRVSIHAIGSGAVVPPDGRQACLKTCQGCPGDPFGYSMAASGDTLVVGAPFPSGPTPGFAASGAVHVFTRIAGLCVAQATLRASDMGANDLFGTGVAISGNTIVVGAPSEDSAATGVNGNPADNGASASGAADVFTRSGTVWTQQAYPKASNTGSGDHSGGSVASPGDTLAVDALGEDSSATGTDGNPTRNAAPDSGAVCVFGRSGGAGSQRARLKASDTGAGDSFYIVALAGRTLAVSANREASNAIGLNRNRADDRATRRGAVCTFGLP